MRCQDKCGRYTICRSGGEIPSYFPAHVVFVLPRAGPIPPELGNLDALQHLFLTDNKLSGESVDDLVDRIPRCNVRINVGGTQCVEAGENIPSYFPAHVVFVLPRAGPIPQELGNLAALQLLYLTDNKLSGESVDDVVDRIPRCNVRINVGGTKYIEAGENILKYFPAHVVFVFPKPGAIPQELGNLDALQHLYLSNNKLSGESVDDVVDRIPGCDVRINVGGTQYVEAGENIPSYFPAHVFFRVQVPSRRGWEISAHFNYSTFRETS